MESRDKLHAAALILAVRTARFEEKEFRGMATPRVASEIAASVWMAERLCRAVDSSHQQQVQADVHSAAREQREAAQKQQAMPSTPDSAPDLPKAE